ncbi:MAG: DUF2384 domain-containing protein [Cocleimonas sp.]|nr:DUF2384 domain-containing protein [Cocleimonas sp.]
MSDKNYSEEQMVSITKATMRTLDSWKLRSEEIMNILGLDEKTRKRSLQSFRSGSKALPQDTETMKRIEHVAGIVEALRTAYPMNAQMRARWLYKPCRRFQGNNPLSVILTEGMNGLIKARIEIDCAYGWELSEQMKIKSQGG